MKSVLYKPTWRIYFNNTAAYAIYLITRMLVKNKKKGKGLLFINTGQIGDLVISSVILLNAQKLNSGYKIYFLLQEKYMELYSDYTGNVEFITWQKEKYKYNIIYRISFLNKLRSLGINRTYNLTAARGITNDELSLLSGAEKVFCLSSNWKYLKKLFGNLMDKKYEQVLNFGTLNEYEKHTELIKFITSDSIFMNKTHIYLSSDVVKRTQGKVKFLDDNSDQSYVVIAPMSDTIEKDWSFENYKELIVQIVENTNYLIILIGTNKQNIHFRSIEKFNPSRIMNTAGRYSLLESAIIVKNSLLYIGNDSGFTHIAKALGTPLLGIVGGGYWKSFFPYNISSTEKYLYDECEYSGCELRCMFSQKYCLTNVTPRDAFNHIADLIPQKRK
ncbi:MAG: glycosyltransferase family 9 protein [Ignavibacteriae bacterium]|nr:lipopolysaccharide heptosyltransferase family protein [Ignavibacteriota bacterium]NOG99439.1 glycosyltransferase family 9 protein [Ignavibacteriota bacterium]